MGVNSPCKGNALTLNHYSDPQQPTGILEGPSLHDHILCHHFDSSTSQYCCKVIKSISRKIMLKLYDLWKWNIEVQL